MGEDDPGVVANGLTTNTVDSVGTNNLSSRIMHWTAGASTAATHHSASVFSMTMVGGAYALQSKHHLANISSPTRRQPTLRPGIIEFGPPEEASVTDGELEAENALARNGLFPFLVVARPLAAQFAFDGFALFGDGSGKRF